MIVIAFYNEYDNLQFEVSFTDNPLELLDNLIPAANQTNFLKAVAAYLFAQKHNQKLMRVSLVGLVNKQLTIWCTYQQGGVPVTKPINLDLSQLAKVVPCRINSSNDDKYKPIAILSQQSQDGTPIVEAYEGLRQQAFENGTLSHQIKSEYSALPLKALLRQDGTIANTRRLPEVLNLKFRAFQAGRLSRLRFLDKIKLALSQLQQHDIEKETFEDFINREEEVINAHSLDAFFETFLFDRLVCQELSFEQRHQFSVKTIRTALYNTAVDIYNHYVLPKDLSVKERNKRKAFFNKIFAAVNIQIIDVCVMSGLLKGKKSDQFVADIIALLSALQGIKWENPGKVFARNVLEVELSKAISHIKSETRRASMFSIEISPLDDYTWNAPVFSASNDNPVINFFKDKHEEVVSSFLHVASHSSEKSRDGLYQDANVVLARKLKEIETLVQIEAQQLEELQARKAADIASSLASSSNSLTSFSTENTATPLTGSSDNLQLPITHVEEIENDNMDDLPPVQINYSLEDSVLLKKIQQVISATTWVTKNVFGITSLTNISMGDDSAKLPKNIREIYLYITQSNDDAKEKLDHIKTLADAALNVESTRRVESTQSLYRQLGSNTSRVQQEFYFNREALFTKKNDGGKRSIILQQLRQYIEETEWEGESLASCNMHMRDEKGAMLLDRNNMPMTKVLRLPKHVKKQYDILEGYFSSSISGPVELVEKRILNKIQKVALDAMHDGGKKTRSDRTKEFYSILSGPKHTIARELESFALETKEQQVLSHELLSALKGWIENTSWLTQSGRLFSQDKNNPQSFYTVKIADSCVSNLPNNIRKQYEILQHYFNALAAGSCVNSIKTLEEIQEMGRNVSTWNANRRSVMTEEYYAIFQQSGKNTNINELGEKLAAFFDANHAKEAAIPKQDRV